VDFARPWCHDSSIDLDLEEEGVIGGEPVTGDKNQDRKNTNDSRISVF
jgi:hypothetical protein